VVILNTASEAAGAESKQEGGTPKTLSTSMKIYLGLVAIMVILAILKSFLPLELNQGQQTPWWQVILVAVLGWSSWLMCKPDRGTAP
jgi:hypothetical protein